MCCSVQFDGKRVVSGAYDYLVKVWDPVEGNCIHTLEGHSNRVYSLQVGMATTLEHAPYLSIMGQALG